MKALASRLILGSVTLLCAPATVFAADGAEHHGLMSLTLYFVNFALYVAVLYFLLGKKIAAGWDKRRLSIQAAATKGERELAEAKRQLSEVESAFRELDAQLTEIKHSLTITSAEEVKQIIVEGHAKAQAAIQQAQAKVAAEGRALEEGLRRELLEQVLNAAEHKLKAQSSPASDKPRREAGYRGANQLVQ